MDDDRRTSAIETADTLAFGLNVGCEVRCLAGPFKGVTGVLVEVRAGGRVLVRVVQGIYIEVPRFCVERLSSEVVS
jgi:hypothetical protein